MIATDGGIENVEFPPSDYYNVKWKYNGDIEFWSTIGYWEIGLWEYEDTPLEFELLLDIVELEYGVK